jgi:hypothetical protein
MALEAELAVYKHRLHEWTEHEGKFVLIHGDQVVGFYSSYEDAIQIGYEKFKLEPFLVKQIQTVEVVQCITRLIAPQVRQIA